MKINGLLRLIALALVALFVLVGCGNTGELGGNDENSASLSENVESAQDGTLYTDVLSYNISYYESNDSNFVTTYEGQSEDDYTIEKRQARLKALVEKYSPDVLCLQEVNSLWWRYVVSNQDSLLNLYGYEYVGNTGCFGNEDGSGHYLELYNLLFYNPERFELVEGGTFWLNEKENEPSERYDSIASADANAERTCTYALLKDKNTGNQTLYATTQLCQCSTIDAGDMNGVQAEIMLNRLEGVANGAPVVICGDFNMTEGTGHGRDTYKLIVEEKGYSDARKSADSRKEYGTMRNWGRNPTWHKGNNETVIDYCFYKNLQAREYKVLIDTFDADNKVSDDISTVGENYDLSAHLGVFTRFAAH